MDLHDRLEVPYPMYNDSRPPLRGLEENPVWRLSDPTARGSEYAEKEPSRWLPARDPRVVDVRVWTVPRGNVR